MRLILHIGTEKTGSTSIQSWLRDHESAMQARGLFQSHVLGHPNNRRLAVYGVDSNVEDDGFAGLGIENEMDHARFRKQLRDAFSDEMNTARKAGAKAVILSSEHCHSRLTSPDMVARLKELFRPHFNTYSIIGFLRPQVDLRLSLLSEAVRMGHRVLARQAVIAPNDPYYDYHALYLRWAEAFPNAVRLIPAKRFPDTVAKMRELLHLDAAQFPSPTRENSAIDYRVAMLSNRISLPRFQSGHPSPLSKLFLDELPGAIPIAFSRAQAEEMQARVMPSNHALAALDVGVTLDDLSTDMERFPETGNLEEHLPEVPYGDQLDALVLRLNGERLLERIRTLIAEVELADLRDDRALALRLITRAKTILGFIQDAKSPALVAPAGRLAKHLVDLEAKTR